MDLEFPGLSSVQARLKLIIGALVDKHRTAGELLTWRLIHEIEVAAIDRLEDEPDLDTTFVGMLRSAGLGSYPKTDEPVNFGNSNAMPVTFSLINEAYRVVH